MSNLYRIRDGVYGTSPSIRGEWFNVTPELKSVLLWFEYEALDVSLNHDIVYTSILRREDTHSVHATGRGADVRIEHQARGIKHFSVGVGLSNDTATRLVSKLNHIFGPWEGNDGKMHDTAIIHGEGLNRHIHIQVPDRAWR